MADRHPKKEIQDVIDRGISPGLGDFVEHIAALLPDGRIFSTPRSPSNHADKIRRRVDRCPLAGN